MVVLTIPGDPPPGENAQHRMHWAAVGRLRRWWASQARLAWMAAGRPRFEHPRIVVRFVYTSARRRDVDNLGVAIKPLLDGLRDHPETVTEGAFRDDSADAIDLRPVEIAVDKHAPRVEIVIEEAAEASA